MSRIAVTNNTIYKIFQMNCYKDVKGTIYDYEAVTFNRKERIQFKQYVGKLVLFVNVATYCDLTAQYPGKNSEPYVFGT
jgi:glutathione peroxidase